MFGRLAAERSLQVSSLPWSRRVTTARLTTGGELAAHEHAQQLHSASSRLTTPWRGALLHNLIAEAVSSCKGNLSAFLLASLHAPRLGLSLLFSGQ